MNRLWVQFSLAITLAIILATLSPLALFFFQNWLYPDTFEVVTDFPPTLTPVEVERLLETVTGRGITLLKVDFYPDGYFSMESIVSLGPGLAQVEEVIQRLPPEQTSKLNIIFENAASLENPALPQTQLYISGRVPITETDSLAARFSAADIQIVNNSFVAENPSIIDTLELFFEEIVRNIVVGLVLGVGLGIWLSRTLTAPLRHLAQAARVIGARELSYRVKVKGSKEVRELADTFNQMSANLERAEQIQRQMMADVSHELRTPLTVLEGNLRAALDRVSRLDEQNLADLYSQTHHLIRLVNDLHEIAQAETNRLPLALHQTDLAELIRQTVDIFGPITEEEGICLKCEIAAGLRPVRVDGARLRQVLHNLLANAVRHTPGGQIILTINQTDRATQISITDTGQGIASEHLAHVFDRFYRTDDSRSRQTGGTGLGLAIVKAIIEAHGGTVTATSPGLNRGTSFTLTLPFMEERVN
ncbi:MAG TPA: ATP-binding protein [Anaerolineae bacterium]|nr:ATP-binding protein [Anaerolineae bacterium]